MIYYVISTSYIRQNKLKYSAFVPGVERIRSGEEWGEATCLGPRLANAVDILAVRHVKQGTETAGLRTGFARTYLCVCFDMNMHRVIYKYTLIAL